MKVVVRGLIITVALLCAHTQEQSDIWELDISLFWNCNKEVLWVVHTGMYEMAWWSKWQISELYKSFALKIHLMAKDTEMMSKQKFTYVSKSGLEKLMRFLSVSTILCMWIQTKKCVRPTCVFLKLDIHNKLN